MAEKYVQLAFAFCVAQETSCSVIFIYLYIFAL